MEVPREFYKSRMIELVLFTNAKKVEDVVFMTFMKGQKQMTIQFKPEEFDLSSVSNILQELQTYYNKIKWGDEEKNWCYLRRSKKYKCLKFTQRHKAVDRQKIKEQPWARQVDENDITIDEYGPSYPYGMWKGQEFGPCAIEDVLAPGFIVGEGCSLQGEPIYLVSIISRPKLGDGVDSAEPAGEYEVIRRISSGSRAVVYLAKEVLFHSLPLEDDYRARPSAVGLGDDITRCSEKVYGREYAIKCLCKANFNEEALVGQFNEAIIHQSLHSHPNIVTLHKTFHTSSFLLLLLEYVPGEDLLHFLAEAHDYYGTDTPNPVSFTRAPPTCNLFSGQYPSRLLSQARLRLITSMFCQMCDAVAVCHSQQVYHRDIKPESFVVTEGWTTLPDVDGRQERKVTVKLTNFSLSTTDVESPDMDCGSVPYMSYEYRNYLASTYRPRAADIWSLGIVLLNMLYHFNPWTDTSQGACASFDLFRRDPVHFLMYRFAGMTQPVAEFLTNRVFCILDDSRDDSCRVTAGEFGVWVENLPILLGSGPNIHRTFSSSSTGYSIAPTPCSPSISTQLPHTPAVTSRPQPHALLPGPHKQSSKAYGLSRVRDQEPEDYPQQREGNLVELLSGEMRAQNEDFTPQMMFPEKHKKPGVRKAVTSQELSPEISTTSRVFSTNPIAFKEPSKSRFPFDKQSTGLSPSALEDNQPPPPTLPPELGIPDSQPDFVKANNVTNLIMRFNGPAHNFAPGRVNNTQDKPLTRTGDHGWQGFATPIAQTNESAGYGLPSTLNTWNLSAWNSSGKRSVRAVSPDSVHGSGRPLASSTSSTTSGDDCSCYYSCMSTTMSLASWRANSDGARSPASSAEGTRQRFNEVKGGVRPSLVELYDQAQGSMRRVTTSAVTSWITEPEMTIRTSLWTFSSVKNEDRGYGLTVRDIFERQLRLR